MIKNKIPVVMSIAGFDPTSGAGVSADMKTISHIGVYGLSVITCIAVQNTKQVYAVIPISVEQVKNQIDTLFDGFTVDVVKIGLLPNADIIDSVVEKISAYNVRVIVDPIMSATTGTSLISNEVVERMREKLFPITFVLTPNLAEASNLTETSIKTVKDMENACKTLHTSGVSNVVVKGGHLPGEKAIDVFYNGHSFNHLSLPKLITKPVHGTGCVFSAGIAGFLAQQLELHEAIIKAKLLTWMLIKKSITLGKESNLWLFSKNLQIPETDFSEEEFGIWNELTQAVETIVSFIPPEAVPEVGMNIAYAKPQATSYLDVCALSGRIIKTMKQPYIYGKCTFGGSQHVAAIILAAQRFNPSIRCAINVRYSKKTLQQIQDLGLTIGTFNRELEPKNTQSSIEWGTTQAIQSLGFVPNVIYDTGGMGKEPMIRILGTNMSEIIEKLKKIWNTCTNNR